jgi:hypothetical protein
VVSKPQSCQPEGVCFLMRREERAYITNRSRKQKGSENIFQSGSEEEDQPEVEKEGDMGDNNEKPEESAMHILNDLARGKQQLL